MNFVIYMVTLMAEQELLLHFDVVATDNLKNKLWHRGCFFSLQYFSLPHRFVRQNNKLNSTMQQTFKKKKTLSYQSWHSLTTKMTSEQNKHKQKNAKVQVAFSYVQSLHVSLS